MATNPQHNCPACGRAFKDILDYPRVRILEFERLPIPEAIDSMSGAAAEKRMARWRAERSEAEALPSLRDDGINMTPLIARACDTTEVQGYFDRLSALQGREVAPQELLPPFPADGIFKRAYPVADTGVYLCISDAETTELDLKQANAEG